VLAASTDVDALGESDDRARGSTEQQTNR